MRDPSILIRPGDFSDERVIHLLREHVAGMLANSPPGMSYALDLSGVQASDITFVTAWQEEQLVGCGAIKELDPMWGELKSMRTASAHLRKGVGKNILEYLLDLARSRGYRRVSLETGTSPTFVPALALYRQYGFVEGEAFGGYASSDFNQFFHLTL